MSGGVKLRTVTGWMAVMLLAASLALAHIWKQQMHARLSREIVVMGRERDALAAAVLLLDTETRGLRQYSRLEAVARQRLGLVNPGPPVMIQPAGQVLASGDQGGAAPIPEARVKRLFR
jgi:cell division protein FtsL